MKTSFTPENYQMIRAYCNEDIDRYYQRYGESTIARISGKWNRNYDEVSRLAVDTSGTSQISGDERATPRTLVASRLLCAVSMLRYAELLRSGDTYANNLKQWEAERQGRSEYTPEEIEGHYFFWLAESRKCADEFALVAKLDKNDQEALFNQFPALPKNTTINPDSKSLGQPPKWEVVPPKQFKNYGEQLHLYLLKKHQQGAPLPTVSGLLTDWEKDPPNGVYEVTAKGFEYDNNRSRKHADVDAIGQTLRRHAKPIGDE